MKKNQWSAVVGMIMLVLALGLFSVPYAQAQQSIRVGVGEAVTIPGENIAKVAIADPLCADVVPLSDKELSIIGKKAGVTSLTIVKNDGSPTQLTRIEVVNDAAALTIREMIGNSNITVRAIGDSLVLDGKVEDELAAQRAVQVATAYKPQIVNLLEIAKPRQIKVRTRIAEVDTEAIKNVGFQWFGPDGQVQYAMQYVGGGSIMSGFIPTASEFGSPGTTFQPTTVTMDVILDVLISKSYARLLSEPTLVTFSGKEASFLVGSEIPIVEQLPQSFTVEFKDVGVRMKVKPVADSENRINTTIHAEVSQLTGTSISGIPIISSKSADTVLQVNDGQTIVIGGLLENNVNKDVLRKLPWLGDIPVLGALFRDKQFDQAKREVLFFMTPEVMRDSKDELAATGAQSPAMKQWVTTWRKGGLLGRRDEDRADERGHGDAMKDDWGLHNADHLGLPYHDSSDEPRAKSKVKNAKPSGPSSSAKPVGDASKAATSTAPAAASSPDTSANFSPARPAE
ncbi:MAG: pilus assembly protein N-terminal domain-containing protein [Verrucomicrobiia bacterium]